MATTNRKFQVRDRVQRQVEKSSRMRYGRISAVYSDANKYGYYPEVYAVEWEDAPGEVQCGFLPHGLDPAPDTPKVRGHA